MDSGEPLVSLETLHRNEARNAPVLARARIAREDVPVVRCGACGTLESARFWTPRGVRGNVLRLECPACGAYAVRYRLRDNRVAHPDVLRRLTGLGGGAVLTLVVTAGAAAGLLFTDGATLMDRLRDGGERLLDAIPAPPAPAAGERDREPASRSRPEPGSDRRDRVVRGYRTEGRVSLVPAEGAQEIAVEIVGDCAAAGVDVDSLAGDPSGDLLARAVRAGCARVRD